MLNEIFKKNAEPESFRKAIIELDGNFSFTTEDMLKLGEAYLQKYPDTSSNRNIENITVGYNIARICLIEKIILGFREKNFFREMFYNHALIDSIIVNLINKKNYDLLLNDYEIMELRLHGIQTEVDSLPSGIIKERFVGGITKIHNTLYLMKSALNQL